MYLYKTFVFYQLSSNLKCEVSSLPQQNIITQFSVCQKPRSNFTGWFYLRSSQSSCSGMSAMATINPGFPWGWRICFLGGSPPWPLAGSLSSFITNLSNYHVAICFLDSQQLRQQAGNCSICNDPTSEVPRLTMMKVHDQVH